ncbi:MAG: Crp/Fnr family transcriptional regulator [Raoultibacter sp.]|jgi:CRP/FNR family transcriptional regulator
MVEPETFSTVVPFWEHLSEQDKKELASISSIQSYGAGACIHNADQACIGVFFVLSGFARAYMLSEEGREITLFRVEKHESCVLSASCVLPLVTFDILVVASEKAELLVMPADYYSKLLERNVAVEAYTYKQATIRFSEVMWVMQQQVFMGLDRRLAIFLLDEIDRTGEARINATHEEIARNIGSAREAVSRMLKTFADKGLVELFRGGVVVLDKRGLREL